VALAGCGRTSKLKTAITLASSVRTSPASSVFSEKQNSLLGAKAALQRTRSAPSSRRSSIQVMKRALVHSAQCFLFKSKSNVEDDYAYGMSEASNGSIPEVMSNNEESSTFTKRYMRPFNNYVTCFCELLTPSLCHSLSHVSLPIDKWLQPHPMRITSKIHCKNKLHSRPLSTCHFSDSQVYWTVNATQSIASPRWDGRWWLELMCP